MKTLGSFAETYRVRATRDGCGESIIPRKLRAMGVPLRPEYSGHIYDYGSGRFGVVLMFESKRRWGSAKRKLVAAGFEIRQDGDSEGTALFDPADAAQARLAIRLARIPARRRL